MIRAAAVLLLLGASPSAAHDSATGHAHAEAQAEDDHADHVAEAHGLRALHAWTRATDGDETLVFVELENRGDATVTLTGGDSPVAVATTLVAFALKDGEPDFATVEALPLDPGAAIALAPYGLALRLTGLSRPLVEGESVVVSIHTDRGVLSMTVAVMDADAAAHDHAGHAHD